MLFSPTGFPECLREWEDLEKNYHQIQVSYTEGSEPCSGKLTVTGGSEWSLTP